MLVKAEALPVQPNPSPRSWLCASALNMRLVEKATESGADVVHFDLEDSVPVKDKERARYALLDQYAEVQGARAAIRINNLSKLDGLRDLIFVLEREITPDFLILAKVSHPQEVCMAASMVHAAHPETKIYAVVENVTGFSNLRSQERRPEGLAGLIFGAADFAADLGVDRTRSEFSLVRQEIVLMARRFGVPAIDAPCFEYADIARLQRECEIAKQFGFHGKIAIHPSQVPVINAEFMPSARAIADASRVLNAQQQSPTRAILSVDGTMVGPPSLEYARKVLSKGAS